MSVNYARVKERSFDLFAAEVNRGAREVGKNNHGPAPKKYLGAVGLPEGHAWCAAMVVWAYDVVCGDEGIPLILPRTGKVAYLIQRCREEWVTSDPSRGAIAIHLEDPTDPDTTGHCGLVDTYERRKSGLWIYTGEGNTDGDGGRDGDEAAWKWRPDDYWNGGYIDVTLTPPPPIPF